jgi:hypothetical protein
MLCQTCGNFCLHACPLAAAAQFIKHNLIPATIGNWIGGSVLVATAYACSLGTPGHLIQVGRHGPGFSHWPMQAVML